MMTHTSKQGQDEEIQPSEEYGHLAIDNLSWNETQFGSRSKIRSVRISRNAVRILRIAS